MPGPGSSSVKPCRDAEQVGRSASCGLPPGPLFPSADTPHHVVVNLHQGCGGVETAQVRVLQALGFLYMVSKKSLSGMRHKSKQRIKSR